MTPTPDRRRFLASCLAFGAGGSWAWTAPKEDAWTFPVLGDLHYDDLSHHEMDWLRKEHPNDVSQVQNYSKVTRESTPRLLEAVKAGMGKQKQAVPFVVQLGDLVEGLCGTEALARRQADDALAAVRKIGFGAPFLFTKGNHDITGPGAASVYDKVLVPFLAAQAGGGVERAAYLKDHQGTSLVFFDAYAKDSLAWFAEWMAARKPGRLLFVIHPPVVPFNARSSWHVYSGDRQEAERAKLLDLLGAARAVVLCGHLHKYSYLVRRTAKGMFSQLAISSVATDAEAKPKDLLEGAGKYSPDLVKLEPKHSPDTEDRRRALLEKERPFIERYEYADTWGHAWLDVRPGGVSARIHRGTSAEAWKTIDLTGPLG